jgi:hypothetical protein
MRIGSMPRWRRMASTLREVPQAGLWVMVIFMTAF